MAARPLLLACALIFTTAAACIPPETAPTTAPPPTGLSALVTRVFDGDTIEVRTDEGSLRVRLDGIDAPDLDECWFEEATLELRLAIQQQEVILEVTGRDQFDRHLAVVWHSGEAINQALVREGHAIATSPASAAMAEAETTARADQIGLWSPDACGQGPVPAIQIDFAGSVIDPPGPDHEFLDLEQITLRNHSSADVDLTGWVLRDESSRHRFRFPSGTTLRSGESIVVRSSDQNWDPGGSAVWNNDGDIIMLLDHHGRVIDAKRY